MGLLRKGAAVVLSLVVVGAGLYGAGIIGPPSAGVEDPGDWGEVTEEETEIVTTLWVNNPNPVGVSLGNLRADYTVRMNDVAVAEGDKEGLDVQTGNNTKELRTYIQNERLKPWWVAYVRANETITMEVGGQATVGTPLGSQTFEFPEQEKTMLENSTPVISGLSEAAGELEGSYTKQRSVGGQEVAVGYEVERASAEWGEVSRNETTVLVRYRVTNAGDAPLPAVPDGFRMNVSMNGVEMFSGGADAMEPRDADRDAVLEPGETQTVTLAVTMDNDKIDDWFRSHVRSNERTDMAVEMSMLFKSERLGTTFSIPRDGPATVECDIRTAILVDNQSTSTDCGAAAP